MVARLSVLVARMRMLRLEDLKREEGQTTVEYAIVVALVVAMAVLVFATLSDAIADFMTAVGASITAALPL
jgi:Flp pilus assembly pilin Flp